MKKLKIGVIGLGIGEKHVRAYQSHPNCEVATLCDFDPEKEKMARQKYSDLNFVADADELLSDQNIDVVSIASYDNYHCEQTLKAINYNKHVMVEKPFCLYCKEAEKIKEALQSKPFIKFSSNLVLRTTPRFRWLKEKIMKGDMGQLFYVDGDYNYGRLHKLTDGWRGKIDFYSVVYGGGLHLVDLLRWLTGDEVKRVNAIGNNISTSGSNFKYNDLVTAILEFESGMTGKVTSNFSCVQPHFHELSIYGTKATFKNGAETGKLFESRDPLDPCQKVIEDYPGVNQEALIHSFINSILGSGDPIVTQEEVFRSMAVCFAIEKALKTSNAVEVTYK